MEDVEKRKEKAKAERVATEKALLRKQKSQSAYTKAAKGTPAASTQKPRAGEREKQAAEEGGAKEEEEEGNASDGEHTARNDDGIDENEGAVPLITGMWPRAVHPSNNRDILH